VINFGLYGATDTTPEGKVEDPDDQPAKSGVLVAGDLVFLAKAMASSTPWIAHGPDVVTFDGPADPAFTS